MDPLHSEHKRLELLYKHSVVVLSSNDDTQPSFTKISLRKTIVDNFT
jgi:hypothetical protein